MNNEGGEQSFYLEETALFSKMSIFKSSATHFILLSFFGFLSFPIEAAPVFNDAACTDSLTFKPNSTFQINLDLLLSYLTSNASLHDGFFRTIVAPRTPSAINGLFFCRGDVNPDVCQECVVAAAKEIRRLCPNQTESLIWYDVCLLRYSNNSFNNIVPSVSLQANNSIGSDEEGPFNQLLATTLNNLTAKAKSQTGKKKFATAEVAFSSWQTLFSLAQCIPDMTAYDCDLCLLSAVSALPNCCSGKKEARVLLPSCMIRYQLYEIHPFYNTTATPSEPLLTPPPAPGEDAHVYARKENGQSRKIIVVVIPTVVSGILLCLACYVLQRKMGKSYKSVLRENFGTESTALESLQFSLATIEGATNKFSQENKIGKGGFGEVYKGILLDGQEIAIKRLSRSSGQGAIEFKNEVLLMAKLQHRNLVTLLGFCLEGQEKIFIYEYVPNNSLDYFLFGTRKTSALNWSERYKIIEGIAQGILYLHKYSRLKIIHRDLKPSNILLNNNMNPKISDFGMARMVSIDETQGSTNRIVGTFGYMSPEYAMFGQFSEKSDVFSFGVMVMEIISGKKNTNCPESQCVDGLLSYAWKQWRNENVLEILDAHVKNFGSQSEVIKCIHIALLCVQESPDARPPIITIVQYLNNDSIELPSPREPAFFMHGRMEPPNIGANEPGSSPRTNNSKPCSLNEMSTSELFPR